MDNKGKGAKERMLEQKEKERKKEKGRVRRMQKH